MTKVSRINYATPAKSRDAIGAPILFLVGIGFALGFAAVACIVILPWADWSYRLALAGF